MKMAPRRTEKKIKNKSANKRNYVGKKEVADKLREVTFSPSTLETIDRAVLTYVDEGLNLSVTTNTGFRKVPVLWVTSERSYQLKHNKDLRDGQETLKLPLMTVNRATVTKDPGYRGALYANLYPANDEKGGTIEIARKINQKKTAEFQNAFSKRKYGVKKDVRSKNFNTNARNMSTQRVVYETLTIPIPTWVKITYEVTLRSEYQQQMNELTQPFMTIPGNSRMPARITSEGHYYEVFIDGGLTNDSNQAALGMEQRNFETTIPIEVLGYLIGEGDNQEKPKIVTRENAVEIKLGREQTIFGDIPENIKDGFYRE
jgi:hypothetical protein